MDCQAWIANFIMSEKPTYFNMVPRFSPLCAIRSFLHLMFASWRLDIIEPTEFRGIQFSR